MSPDFYQLLKLNPLGKHEKALREHFSHFLYWLWAAQNTDSWHKPQFLIKGRYRLNMDVRVWWKTTTLS